MTVMGALHPAHCEGEGVGGCGVPLGGGGPVRMSDQ